MQLSRVFFLLALALAPVALLGTTWLYLYPLFDTACSFPSPPNATAPAPFRLLALGDPQLEGDSSLPKAGAKIFRSFDGLAEDLRDADTTLRKGELVWAAIGGTPRDLKKALEGYVRKPIDIWGNDLYLAHIVRTLRWWAEPSHVAVLGDLLGSQWVRDQEFERRAGRYWGTVFQGMERVPEKIMTGYEDVEMPQNDGKGKDQVEEDQADIDQAGGGQADEIQADEDHAGENQAGEDQADEGQADKEVVQEARERKWGGTVEILGEDEAWKNRVINIAGNHDIGYAGDIDASRISRFERAFGSVNWDIVFKLPNTTLDSLPNRVQHDDIPALRLVILNTMNLDTPAYDGDLQRETYDFINHVITTSRSVTDKTHATILLTHIPLHKEAGVCVDSPFFNFFDHGGVKEQNMLSEYSSKIVLESIFGLSSNQWADGNGFGRRGIVINGHDHAGCDVLHYTTQPGVQSTCPQNIDESDIHLPPVLPDIEPKLSSEEALEESITSNDTLADAEAQLDAVAESQSEAQPGSEPEPQSEEAKWQVQRFPHRPYRATPAGECIALNKVPRIREVTLRSMMGEFSGYAGFLSAWFDAGLGEKGEWVIELNTCGLGVQHWWWAVHVVDMLLALAVLLGAILALLEGQAAAKAKNVAKAGSAQKNDRVGKLNPNDQRNAKAAATLSAATLSGNEKHNGKVP